MRLVKKVDKATRRRRQQWRDSKQRARARERAYKDAMRQEADRQKFAPVTVELNGVDLTPHVHSVDVSTFCEDVDVTMGGFFGDEPDQWKRRVPGLKSRTIQLGMISDSIAGDWYAMGYAMEPKQLRIERLGHVEFEGQVVLESIMREAGGAGDLMNTTIVLRPVAGARA